MIAFYKFNGKKPMSPIILFNSNEFMTRREIFAKIREIDADWASVKRNEKVIEDYEIQNNRLTVCHD